MAAPQMKQFCPHDDAPLLQWMYTEYTKKLSLAKQNKAVPNSATAQWQGKMITLKKETINDTLYWTTQHILYSKYL